MLVNLNGTWVEADAVSAVTSKRVDRTNLSPMTPAVLPDGKAFVYVFQSQQPFEVDMAVDDAAQTINDAVDRMHAAHERRAAEAFEMGFEDDDDEDESEAWKRVD